MNKTSLWLHGLAAAVIGGVATSISGAIVAPDTFNLTQEGLLALGKLSMVSAIVSAALYLKQSPLPPRE